MRFTDANGLAGFMSLGFVQAGYEMALRTGDLDFGNASAEANRHLFGENDWTSVFSTDAADWVRASGKIDVVAGLPPCSAWSSWTGTGAGGRNNGANAAALQHTWNLVSYAGYVKPDAVVYESVQQAFSQGRDVMLSMRAHLEDVSGLKYDLHHVKMNNLMIGGKSYRPRYFWVATRSGIPFRAAAEWPDRVPSIMETIGDLQFLDDTWQPQPYNAAYAPSVSHLISDSGFVDGHKMADNVHHDRVKAMFATLEANGDEWKWGEGLSAVLKRIYETTGEFPPGWDNKKDKIIEKKFAMGFSLPYRWPGNGWANVLTGGALEMVVHPTQPRCISHREAARIQGLPDEWYINPVKEYRPLGDTWGKAVSVDAGRWIAQQVKRSLEGSPVGEEPEKIGQREYMHHTDKGFSREAARKRYFPGTKGGITKVFDLEKYPKQPA